MADEVIDLTDAISENASDDFIASENFLNVYVQFKGKEIQLKGIGLDSILKSKKSNKTQRTIASYMIKLIKAGKTPNVRLIGKLNGPSRDLSEDDLDSIFFED